MTEAYFDEFALRYLVKVNTKALKVRIFFNTALAYRLLVEQRASLLIKSYNLFFNVLKIRRILFVNVRIAFFYAFKIRDQILQLSLYHEAPTAHRHTDCHQQTVRIPLTKICISPRNPDENTRSRKALHSSHKLCKAATYFDKLHLFDSHSPYRLLSVFIRSVRTP